MTWLDWLSVSSFILSLVSLGVAFYSLKLMKRIAREQDELTNQLSNKVLGTLTSAEAVYEQILTFLKEANEEKCPVYWMCYWLWFGVDLQYPDQHKIFDLNGSTSEIGKLLKTRAVLSLPTTIVAFDPNGTSYYKLRQFITAVLEFNITDKKWLGERYTAAEYDSLVARYLDDFYHIEDLAEKSARQFHLHPTAEIPGIFFVKAGVKPAAVCFLLELQALEEKAPGGGFVTHDKIMVDIIKAQITRAARIPPQT